MESYNFPGNYGKDSLRIDTVDHVQEEIDKLVEGENQVVKQDCVLTRDVKDEHCGWWLTPVTEQSMTQGYKYSLSTNPQKLKNFFKKNENFLIQSYGRNGMWCCSNGAIPVMDSSRFVKSMQLAKRYGSNRLRGVVGKITESLCRDRNFQREHKFAFQKLMSDRSVPR